LSLEVGSRIGDYRIVSRLGAGACAEVYEAEHVITRRVEAVKILAEGHPPTPEEEQRFLREIQVQASLHHSNLAAVHNAFSTPQGFALVMELVKGESLRAILERGRMPLAQGVGYVLGTLSGLIYAEMQGVVHRDVKPENIMVTPDGSVKLTDFGLAQTQTSPRLTQPGTFAGSPCYMSPEQAMATTGIDRRSDVYSTGVVLYEIVTGRPPFQDKNGFAVMLAHQSTRPKPPIELEPAIGPALNRVILKALEKEPSQRFQNALEFHTALKVALAAALAPAAKPAAARARAQRRVVIAASLLACAGAVAASAAHFADIRKWVAAAVAQPPAAAPTVQEPAPTPVEMPEAPQQLEPAAAISVKKSIPRSAPLHRTEVRSRPARAPLRITSTERGSTAQVVSPEAQPPKLEVQASAPVPNNQAPAALNQPPAAPVAAVADGQPPAKQRNVVVRTLGKFIGKFKKRPEAAASFDRPAPSDPDSRSRPAPER
jgi:hypothetical protein